MSAETEKLSRLSSLFPKERRFGSFEDITEAGGEGPRVRDGVVIPELLGDTIGGV